MMVRKGQKVVRMDGKYRGVVYDINPMESYPVKVTFDDRLFGAFTYDGRFLIGDECGWDIVLDEQDAPLCFSDEVRKQGMTDEEARDTAKILLAMMVDKLSVNQVCLVVDKATEVYGNV